jgi:hypothetical protein
MICQMSLSKSLKLLNCSYFHDFISVSLAPNSSNCPLAPNSGGTRKYSSFKVPQNWAGLFQEMVEN